MIESGVIVARRPRPKSAEGEAPKAAQTRDSDHRLGGCGVRGGRRPGHRTGPRRAPPGHPVRDCLGAQRLREDVPAAGLGLAQPHVRGPVRPRNFTCGVDRDADLVAPDQRRAARATTRSRSRWPCHTKIWGLLHETLVVPFTGSGSGRARPAAAIDPVPGPAAGRAPATRDAARAPRRRCSPAMARRWRKGPIGRLRSPTSPSRSSARCGPIPKADASVYEAAGYPPNTKVGTDGLERVFESQLAGTPGGRLLAGHRVLASAAPVKAKPVKTTIVALARTGVGGRDGRPVRRDHGHGPAHGRAAGARRDRLLGAPAAGIDDEDHHHDGRAAGRDHDAVDHLSDRDLSRRRRLHAPERGRRGLRRDAAQRVRRLLQLGVRPARGQARRPPAGRDRAAVRLRPAVVDRGRGREHDPFGEQDRRRDRGRLLGDRAGARARRRRSRWPTSPRRSRWEESGRSRRWPPTRSHSSCTSRARASRTRYSR